MKNRYTSEYPLILDGAMGTAIQEKELTAEMIPK